VFDEKRAAQADKTPPDDDRICLLGNLLFTGRQIPVTGDRSVIADKRFGGRWTGKTGSSLMKAGENQATTRQLEEFRFG